MPLNLVNKQYIHQDPGFLYYSCYLLVDAKKCHESHIRLFIPLEKTLPVHIILLLVVQCIQHK
jgi:hypothetical protein